MGLATSVSASGSAFFVATARFFATVLAVFFLVVLAGFFPFFLIVVAVALKDTFLVFVVTGVFLAVCLAVCLAVAFAFAFADVFVGFLIAGDVVLEEAFLATREVLGAGT